MHLKTNYFGVSSFISMDITIIPAYIHCYTLDIYYLCDTLIMQILKCKIYNFWNIMLLQHCLCIGYHPKYV